MLLLRPLSRTLLATTAHPQFYLGFDSRAPGHLYTAPPPLGKPLKGLSQGLLSHTTLQNPSRPICLFVSVMAHQNPSTRAPKTKAVSSLSAPATQFFQPRHSPVVVSPPTSRPANIPVRHLAVSRSPSPSTSTPPALTRRTASTHCASEPSPPFHL